MNVNRDKMIKLYKLEGKQLIFLTGIQQFSFMPNTVFKYKHKDQNYRQQNTFYGSQNDESLTLKSISSDFPQIQPSMKLFSLKENYNIHEGFEAETENSIQKLCQHKNQSKVQHSSQVKYGLNQNKNVSNPIFVQKYKFLMGFLFIMAAVILIIVLNIKIGKQFMKNGELKLNIETLAKNIRNYQNSDNLEKQEIDSSSKSITELIEPKNSQISLLQKKSNILESEEILPITNQQIQVEDKLNQNQNPVQKNQFTQNIIQVVNYLSQHKKQIQINQNLKRQQQGLQKQSPNVKTDMYKKSDFRSISDSNPYLIEVDDKKILSSSVQTKQLLYTELVKVEETRDDQNFDHQNEYKTQESNSQPKKTTEISQQSSQLTPIPNPKHSFPSSRSTTILQTQLSKHPFTPTPNHPTSTHQSPQLSHPSPPPHLTCPQHIDQQLKQHGWLYQFSIPHQDLRMSSGVNAFKYNEMTQLSEEQYSEAIDLLEVVHHAGVGGRLEGKGGIDDTPCEQAQSLRDRLIGTMERQFVRLDQMYHIDAYHHKQLRFCIVANSYKNARNGLIYRNIDSILQQNYTNYHVVYTDDASSDDTGLRVNEYLAKKNVSQQKFKVKINEFKLGMMENIYRSITNDCELSEIAVMLDGDDSFIGTNVLSLLNALYQREKIALMWNNFLQIKENSKVFMGFSKSFDQYEMYHKLFRQPGRFFSSHLKSFYVDLFRQIKVEDLQQENGRFYGGASDTAMMISILEMAFPKFKYVPELVYEYRYDTGQLGMAVNKDAQQRALSKIQDTKPYQALESFGFIDEALEKVLKL